MKNKDFSSWSPGEIIDWLNLIGLARYTKNFEVNCISGYDLCYLTNDDFSSLGIQNIHDKNILIKHIRNKTLEECKIFYIIYKNSKIKFLFQSKRNNHSIRF